jgi:hypothetical protein
MKRWEDKIKLEFRGIGCEEGRYLELAEWNTYFY